MCRLLVVHTFSIQNSSSLPLLIATRDFNLKYILLADSN